MEIEIFANKQQNLLKQRDILLGVSGLLLLSNMLLGICLISTERQTLLIPANLTKEVLVGNKHLSTSYLEEMTQFYLSMLLELNSSNIDYKTSLILRHIHPSFYQHIFSFLAEESKRYKAYNLSTYFALQELKIDEVALIAQARGMLVSYYGKSGKSEDLVTYRLEYGYAGGILSIKNFTIIKDEKNNEDDNN